MPPATDASNRSCCPRDARQIAELRAVMRDQLLVRGHDRLARQQRRPHPFVRRMQPADELDDDVDVARQDVVDRLGPGDRRRHPVDALARRRRG